MADIFLSYARADQPRIEKLATALEDAGYTLWWDRHLEGGSQFSKDIERHLHSASAVIVAWSKNSVESEWVRDEAAIARDADKLVPIGLDGTLPPIGFRQRQAIDFSQEESGALPSLKAALDKYIDGERADLSTSDATSKKKIYWALLLAPLLLMGVAAAWFFMQTESDDDAITAVRDARDSIAILPFVAQSSDEDDQFFADGVTEEILNRLDAVEELRVLPRTTVFSLRDNSEALDVLADKLGVDYIVEGSLRRGGDNVRVTARLIRTSDDETLWSNSYDGSREDVLAFQSDIAEKVALSLDVLLNDEVLARMDSAGLNDPETFALFAKASKRDALAHGSLINRAELYEVSQMYDEVFERAPEFWEAAIDASDFYSHLIIDPVPGEELDDLSARLIPRAPAEMRRRLAQARAATNSRQDQLSIDLYAQAFSDDWSELPKLSESYYANFEGCELPNWAGFLTDSIGDTDSIADAYLAGEDCRASDRLFVSHTIRALGRAGRIEEARAYIERQRNRGILSDFSADEARLELFAGNLDKAIEIVQANPADDVMRMLLEENPAVVEIVERAGEGRPAWMLLALYARSGERERVNELAAKIDARPGGPTTLQQAIDWCSCGSVFDIEYTPNYAAVLERSGVKWPFRKLQDWPMKDW